MLGKSIAKIGSWRPRAPFKPITVGASPIWKSRISHSPAI